MKKIFIFVSVITIGLIVLTSQSDNDAIIIYASTEQFRNDELQNQISEKFPYLDVRVMYMPTAKAAAKIIRPSLIFIVVLLMIKLIWFP